MNFATRFFSVMVVLLAINVGIAEEPDALDQLNNSFREAHAKMRTATLERSGPIIVVDRDKLVLWHNKNRTEIEAVPALYHELKAVAHAPLGVFLIVKRLIAQGPFSEDDLQELRRMREVVKAASTAVDKKKFTPEQLHRQRSILGGCEEFLGRVIAAKWCEANDLNAFARKQRPLFMANANEAAQLQLDAYDVQTAKWREELPASDWNKLQVIVIGSALPRKENLAVQFFAKVLGQAGEGDRILYAEGLFEEAKALRLMATSRVDAAAASAFFDDSTRLHRDLLADVAKNYLSERGGDLKSLGPQQKEK